MVTRYPVPWTSVLEWVYWWHSGEREGNKKTGKRRKEMWGPEVGYKILWGGRGHQANFHKPGYLARLEAALFHCIESPVLRWACGKNDFSVSFQSRKETRSVGGGASLTCWFSYVPANIAYCNIMFEHAYVHVCAWVCTHTEVRSLLTQCWGDRQMPLPDFLHGFWGHELRSSCLYGKHLAHWAISLASAARAFKGTSHISTLI